MDVARLIGTWPAFMVRAACGRDWRAAIVGWSPNDQAQLARAGARFAETGELLALGGSCVSLLHAGERLAIVGDLAGQRPVFYKSTPAGLVFCSSARTLAGWVAARPSVSWLAARLLAPDVPETWASRSAFEGVRAVPPGFALVASPDGFEIRPRPALAPATLDLAAGGRALRDALTSAVSRRADAATRMSVDLSGGLDSTTLALLSAQAVSAGGTVDGLTLAVDTGTSDDLAFATAAAQSTRGLRQIVAEVPRIVDPYAALQDSPPTDEPYDDAPLGARLRWWSERAAAFNANVHLSGDGGDGVLVGPPSYLADLARRRAWRALFRHAYGWARLRRRPPHSLIRAAVRAARKDRRAALDEFAASLRDAVQPTARDEWERLVDWNPWPPATSWATARARHLAAEAVERAGEDPDTVALMSGDRAAMAALRAAGRIARLREEIWVQQGVELHTPYLDDEVVRTCFEVTASVRTSPEVVKPLLQVGLEDVLPSVVRCRRTKGDYTSVTFRGARNHAHELRALFDQSRLAEYGLLVDARMREVVDRAGSGLRVPLAAMDQVIGIELWLRTLPSGGTEIELFGAGAVD